LKRIILVTVVVAGLLGVRVALAVPHWAACVGNTGVAVYLSVEHLGAPPSPGDCLLLGLGRALDPPPPTSPASVPPPSLAPGEWVDPGYGTKSCAEGGCTVHGPCPNGVPPASHYDCTDTTLDPGGEG
jgi:hypothetical protein